MGVLGKDYLDFERPITHTKVQFGEKQYWIEENTLGIPYGTILTDILNFDATTYINAVDLFRRSLEQADNHIALQAFLSVREEFLKLPFYSRYMDTLGWFDIFTFAPNFIEEIKQEMDKISFLFYAAEDIPLIQERYAWFITDAIDDGGQRRKKGQRKLPPAQRMIQNIMEPYISGRSLGKDPKVDAPNVQLQYVVFEYENESEIVEKIYFDRLLDFVYVELMKGLQKCFIPKQCPNCGKWFVQEPGMDFNYCANPSPQDPTKQCRDIGSMNSFLDKKKNHEIWGIHQRAYRKYYARMMKKNMTRTAFFEWEEDAKVLRNEFIPKYDAADMETRKFIAEEFRLKINLI